MCSTCCTCQFGFIALARIALIQSNFIVVKHDINLVYSWASQRIDLPANRAERESTQMLKHSGH